MTHFKYKGVSRSGAQVTGIVEAYDRYDAVSKIKPDCPVVLEISESSGKDVGELFAKKKVNIKPLSLMCNQFAIILGAGLPLVRCVELVAEQITDKTLKRILTQVAGDVAAGSPLSTSFENRGPFLPVTFIESIRAGEESGNLDDAFSRLSHYFSKAAKTKQKVTSALVYPCFVIAVAIIVIAVIMLYAIPQISATFADNGSELPGLTKAMIGMSNFFGDNILIIAAVIVALIVGLSVYKHTETGRLNIARFVLKIPVIGKISALSNSAQFANTMSTMVASGIPIMRSVGIAGRAMSNYAMGTGVQQTAIGLESGKRLAECLGESQYLPRLLIEMTAVGEETGSLENTLDVISDYYDNESDTKTARALSLLEPALIVVLAVFVMLVLLSVYLPIFGMYDNVGLA